MAITEIRNNYNNVYEDTYMAQKNDTKNQKENVDADIKPMAKQPVEISISNEGLEYYRNSIQKEGHESYDTVLQRKEQLKEISIIDYSLELQKKVAANAEGKGLSTADKANGYVNAYAEMYDEIVQGYENGTREIYVQDENGTHKLTKDEELSALDVAYKKTVDDFVTREKTNQHARKIITEAMEKISKISSRSTLAETYLEEQKTKGTDAIPENLNEKMYQAIVSFKEQYAMFNPNANQLLQLLANIKIS